MYLFYLGNTLSLIGSACLLFSTFSKTKKKLVACQIFDCIFNGLSNLALGGISGLIVNTLALLRNSLVYFNFTGVPLATAYSIVLLGMSYRACHSIIDWLPAVSSVVYCYVICLSKSVTNSKLALVFNQFGWFAFNLHIQAYPMLATNVIIVITAVYYIIHQNKELENKEITPLQ